MNEIVDKSTLLRQVCQPLLIPDCRLFALLLLSLASKVTSNIKFLHYKVVLEQTF